MGGRGASGGPEKTTLDEFLGRRGLRSPVDDYMLDKLRLPHGQTLRQRNAMEKEAWRRQVEYSNRRQAAIKEYNQLKESGKIKERTHIEQLLRTARGNPDNDSVQAARRALEKRGINWKTGRKKKK